MLQIFMPIYRNTNQHKPIGGTDFNGIKAFYTRTSYKDRSNFHVCT